MPRSYIKHVDKYSCTHAYQEETDYDIMSGHSSYVTKCQYLVKPDQTYRTYCRPEKCPHQECIKHYCITNPTMRIRARDWLAENTITQCLKPVSAGMGTIELPPKILGIQGIKVFHCDSGNEVILQINRDNKIPDPNSFANNLQEIIDKSYPTDLVKLINTAIENKYDSIEIASI